MTCDERLHVFVDGKQIGKESHGYENVTRYTIPPDAHVLAVKCHSGIKQSSIHGGILGSLSTGMITNTSWRCSNTAQQGWNEAQFDDSSWPIATKHGTNSKNPADWFPWGMYDDIALGALWIWTKDNQKNDSTVYCRFRLRNESKCAVTGKYFLRFTLSYYRCN